MDALILEEFLPYRLSVLANTVSSALARRYQERFDLSIPQWRVMAVVGASPGLSATEVVQRTAMDKVSVSRAVSVLTADGRLERTLDESDARRKSLRLSARGRAQYRRIVPLARELERGLLVQLTPRDRSALARALDRLLASARELDASDRPGGSELARPGD